MWVSNRLNHSVAGTVTGLQGGPSTVRFPEGTRDYSFFQTKDQSSSEAHPATFSMDAHGNRGVRITTLIYLGLRLRISGLLPPLPIHDSTACIATTLPF